MKIGIQKISIAFTLFAISSCLYSLLISPDKDVKTHAIYWFYAAIISAMLPYIEQVAAYIKTIKLGGSGIEITMNEVKKEINKIDQKIENLDKNLLQALDQVSKHEATLSAQTREVRQQNYDSWTVNVLNKMSPQDKLATQESLTYEHLKKEGVELIQLKKMLGQLGYYKSTMDSVFNPDLFQAVEKFQMDNKLGVPDGIAGAITLSRINELLKLK